MPASTPTRRAFLSGLAGVGAAAEASDACLAVRALRWIVPNPPGGGFDTYSRLLAPYLGRELGLAVHLANEPGASGLRGLQMIRNAQRDGGTLGLGNMPGALMMHELGAFAIDPVRELTVLGGVAHLSYYFAAAVDSRLRSFEDLVEAGRSGKLVVATAATAGVSFLSTAIAAELLGWKLQYVPGYNGSGARALAAMRGEVDVAPMAWDSLAPLVRSGDLRPLAALDQADPDDYPSLAGVPNLLDPNGPLPAESADAAAALVRFMRTGRILVAPAGLEPEVERCLSDAACRALQSSELEREAARRGSPLQSHCAEEALERVRRAQDDIRRLAPLARRVIAEAGL